MLARQHEGRHDIAATLGRHGPVLHKAVVWTKVRADCVAPGRHSLSKGSGELGKIRIISTSPRPIG